MKPGYYLIKQGVHYLPARWDGERYHHERGSCFPHADVTVLGELDQHIMPLVNQGCTPGCECTQNPDGSVTQKCA